MSDYFYLDDKKQKAGPVSRHEIQDMQRLGALTGESLLLPAGTSEWVPLGRLEDKGMQSTTEPDDLADRLDITLQDWMERMDGLLAILFDRPGKADAARTAKFRKYLRFLNNLTHTGILASGLLAALVITLISLHYEQSYTVILGTLLVPCSFLLFYVSHLVAEANLRLAFGPKILLVSPLLPRLVAAGSCLLALLTLVQGMKSVPAAFSFGFATGAGALLGTAGITALLIQMAWTAANSTVAAGVEFSLRGVQNGADYLCNLVRFLGRFVLLALPAASALGMTLFSTGLAVLFFQLQTGDTLSLLGSSMSLRNLLQAQPLTEVLQLTGLDSALFKVILFTAATPILGQAAGHLLCLLLTFVAEVGHGFFRVVEAVQSPQSPTQSTLAEEQES